MLTVNGEFRLSSQGVVGILEGRMFSLATNGGTVVLPANGQHQSREGDPCSSVLRWSLVLLAVAGRYLLLAHVPLQLGGRVGSGSDALELKVLSGCGRDLDGASIVADTLDDNFAWWF